MSEQARRFSLSLSRSLERSCDRDPFALRVVRFTLAAILDYSRELKADQRIALAEKLRDLADEVESGH